CDERARLRMDEPKVDLGYSEARERADERASRRPGRDAVEVAAALLRGHERVERAAREFDGEVVDSLEHDLAVHGEPRQQLEQARREGAVVRAELEQLQLADVAGARLRRDELPDRERVQETLRLGLEDDCPADRVVEPLVDLRLGQCHGGTICAWSPPAST